MRQVGPSDARMLRDASATKAWGESGYSLYERTTIRPALTVSGVVGGYQGPGVKAAIPTCAVAKLNFRLVPDQDPREIDQLFREYVARIAPPGVRTAVRTLMRANQHWSTAPIQRLSPPRRAYRRAFGAPTVFLRNGGTIPVVNLLHKDTGNPRRADGLRPARRSHPRAERKISSSELPQRDRDEHPVSCRDGRTADARHPGNHGAPSPAGSNACIWSALMIIDCHCHAGKGDGLTGPWDTAAPLDKYLVRAAQAGITHTVLFAAFHSDNAVANEEVARIVSSRPDRFFGFAFVNAVHDRGRGAKIGRRAVEEFGFVGVKLHRYDAPISREICEVARAFSLPVLYDVMGAVSVCELLAQEYPDVNFIIPHLGSFADDWRAQIAFIDHLVRHPNIYTDSAGVRRFDILVQAVERAGARKILFGSDGPWLHPGVELAKMRRWRCHETTRLWFSVAIFFA